MAKTDEARHVPDLAVGFAIVVGIEPTLSQRQSTTGAPGVVPAPAVDLHEPRREVRVRVKAVATPIAALRTAL